MNTRNGAFLGREIAPPQPRIYEAARGGPRTARQGRSSLSMNGKCQRKTDQPRSTGKSHATMATHQDLPYRERQLQTSSYRGGAVAVESPRQYRHHSPALALPDCVRVTQTNHCGWTTNYACVVRPFWPVYPGQRLGRHVLRRHGVLCHDGTDTSNRVRTSQCSPT